VVLEEGGRIGATYVKGECCFLAGTASCWKQPAGISIFLPA